MNTPWANARFAETVDPENKALQEYAADVRAKTVAR